MRFRPNVSLALPLFRADRLASGQTGLWFWIAGAAAGSLFFIPCYLVGSAKLIPYREEGLTYPCFVVVNLVLWMGFSEALRGPSHFVRNSRYLFERMPPPSEALILANLFRCGYLVAPKFLLLILLAPLLGGVWSWKTLGLFPLLLFALLLGNSIGLLVAPFSLPFKKVTKGLSAVAGYFFVVTPITYSHASNGWLGQIVAFNPLSDLLVMWRLSFRGNALVPHELVGTALVALVSFSVSAWLFVRFHPRFSEGQTA